MSSLSSLASTPSAVLGNRRSDAAIQELDDNDVPLGEPLAFQYFPSSIQDTKSVDWVPKVIPGGSLPLYQWVSSGERSIRFTAVFTTDVDFTVKAQGDTAEGKSRSVRDMLKSVGHERRNVDIRAAVAWLRRFMLPRYGAVPSKDLGYGTILTSAPHKLQLLMPGSGIGLVGGAGPSMGTADSVISIMTACDVTWEQYFPSGFPRIATVSLGFAQVAQYRGMVQFPDASDLDAEVGATDKSAPFGYTLRPRK